jgi:putative membrane protein
MAFRSGDLIFWGLLITIAVLLAQYLRLGRTTPSSPAEVSPQQIAAERFARGEINEDEYLRLVQVLSGGSAEASHKQP